MRAVQIEVSVTLRLLKTNVSSASGHYTQLFAQGRHRPAEAVRSEKPAAGTPQRRRASSPVCQSLNDQSKFLQNPCVAEAKGVPVRGLKVAQILQKYASTRWDGLGSQPALAHNAGQLRAVRSLLQPVDHGAFQRRSGQPAANRCNSAGGERISISVARARSA